MAFQRLKISGTSASEALNTTAIAPNDSLLAPSVLQGHETIAAAAAWRIGLAVTIGQVYLYNALLYKVVQAHTTQSDWTPDVARSLFTRWFPPTAIVEWAQPLGSFDAYPLGAKVTHNTFTWQSDISANVFEPGVSSWTNLTPPVSPNWTIGVLYHVNDVVTYQAHTYRCLQQNTAIASWCPACAGILNVLWVLVA